MATHPSGDTVEILGIECGTNGRTCDVHTEYCGELIKEDVVLRLRKVQVYIEGQGEVPAIAAYHVSDGIDQCRVGFLSQCFVRNWRNYDGVLVQVTDIYNKDSESKEERRKCYKNLGCCKAAIISLSPLLQVTKKPRTETWTQTETEVKSEIVPEVVKSEKKPRKKKETKNPDADSKPKAVRKPRSYVKKKLDKSVVNIPSLENEPPLEVERTTSNDALPENLISLKSEIEHSSK
jgi:hypothetical protein